MKVLHLMVSGGVGGIEILNRDYVKHSKLEHIYMFVWQGGCIADEMRAAGNVTIELNASKRDFFGPLKKVADICRTEKVDAIIVHYIAPVLYLYAMHMKRMYPDIKVFAYVHEEVGTTWSTAGKIRGKLKTWVIDRFLHETDRIIAVSDFVKQSLIQKYHLSGSKIKVIYNGINIERFGEKLHISEKQLELIYVGRLVPEKGIQNTLKALALLPPDCRFRFRIAGDGDYREVLENIVKQYHLESRVAFLGARNDIPQLLAEADVFIHMPEREEGFGIAVIEAMASGLVCVCCNSGAIPEIIEDQVNGYIVSRENPQELAECLQQLMEDISSESVEQLRIAARRRAGVFSMTSYAAALDQFINKECSQEKK